MKDLKHMQCRGRSRYRQPHSFSTSRGHNNTSSKSPAQLETPQTQAHTANNTTKQNLKPHLERATFALLVMRRFLSLSALLALLRASRSLVCVFKQQQQ
jgi:hypothetical protein